MHQWEEVRRQKEVVVAFSPYTACNATPDERGGMSEGGEGHKVLLFGIHSLSIDCHQLFSPTSHHILSLTNCPCPTPSSPVRT